MTSTIEAPLNLPAIQPDSAPPAAVATPAGNPAENPAGNASATPAATGEAQAAPAESNYEDFDENQIPESSRDNFKKYREAQQRKLKERDDRLNESIRKQYETDARLRQIEAQRQQPIDPKTIGEMPKLEDPQYKDIESYTKALVEWAKKAGHAEFQQNMTQRQADQQRLREAADLQAKGQKAIQKYTDFQQVVQPLTQFAESLPVLQQYVKESEAGTDVLYHLCKNPSLLEALSKMTPVAQIKELFRLEGLASAPQAKKQTQAPAPITPVGGGDGNVKTMLEMVKNNDVSDYVAREHRKEIRRLNGK